MKSDLTKEEMLKRIKELEDENKKLKSKSSSTLSKEDAFEALKNLITWFTQNYSSLWEWMDMSDRTLRNFVSWSADDASEKTYWIIWDYFNKQLRETYQELLRYRAYASAPDDEQRAELYKKLSTAYDGMLSSLEWLIHKRIYTIDERNFKATWEYVNGWFVVYKWSELSYHVLDDSNVRIMRARKELYMDWIIEKDSNTHKVYFLQDFKFRSPSAAAEVICWRPVNWRSKWKSEWKTLDGLERNE